MRRPSGLEEAAPESDRFDEAPHPRETHALFGHAEAERTLLDAWRSGRLPHAWIIGGGAGIGKATLAWRFARFLLAHPDPASPQAAVARDLSVDSGHPAARRVATLAHGNLSLLRREWDSKTKKHFTSIRVDDVREAQKMFRLAAAEPGPRVGIIDSADDLNVNAANALLKLIEEPPKGAVFLIIAHRPGLVMPTIRSRCARLTLEPLGQSEVEKAVKALGTPWADLPAHEIGEAAAGADGSVRTALQRLDPEARGFVRMVDGMLAGLPRADMALAHKLADLVAPRGAEARYEAFLDSVRRWLDGRLRVDGASAQRLAPYAAVWENLRAAAAETEALNLDRRPLVLSLVRDLAEAERRARG